MAVSLPIHHPDFYSALYRESLKHSPSTTICPSPLEEESLLQRNEQAGLQEGCSITHLRVVRRVVEALIQEDGEWNWNAFEPLIQELQQHLYSLGLDRRFDAKRQEHLLRVLLLLRERKELQRFIYQQDKPLQNPIVEEAIRYTLDLGKQANITSAHTRRAVLAAWATYLRQNVGSCFATAPAILIQEEAPEHLLQDLSELITSSRLKRTFGGKEYAVPISTSWGGGDLKKPIWIRFENGHITPEIWSSPALAAACKATGWLDKTASSEEEKIFLHTHLQPLLRNRLHQASLAFVTAEELLTELLQTLLEISPEQLKEFQQRPRPMIQSQLLLHTSPTHAKQRSSSLGQRCTEFLASLEVAKNTFKAFSENALLKTWEFTLASFSETKYDLTRWNFYASLGLGSDELGGIGHCIYRAIQGKIDENNQAIQELQPTYEAAFTYFKIAESRLQNTREEKDAEWLRIDYRNRLQEVRAIEERRDAISQNSQALTHLYETLHETYSHLFENYFQEVYDPDLQEVVAGPFDDAPAGFRLLYKHGRANPSQWTRIYTPSDYSESLASFFAATEPQVADTLPTEDLKRFLGKLVTDLIHHVKTTEFLESALMRMAMAHKTPLIKNPLHNLEHVEKKPWVYTSGGTMNSLISCYYKLESTPYREEKWVESPMELFVFLVDCMKNIPERVMQPFLQKKRFSILMHSPTHAFLLKPNLQPFKTAWQGEGFTYTFLRDTFVNPARAFLDTLLLSEEMMLFLLQELLKKVPENFRPRFQELFSLFQGTLAPVFFRDLLVDALENDRGLQNRGYPILHTTEIDSLLHRHLPFFPQHQLRDRLQQMFSRLSRPIPPEIFASLSSFPASTQSFLSAEQLQNIAKALLCLHFQRATTEQDEHFLLAQAAQKLGFACPTPILFADTNWTKDFFAFVVNPGNGEFELWRMDYTGSIGYPMPDWIQWLNGSRTDRKWGVFTHPQEYLR